MDNAIRFYKIERDIDDLSRTVSDEQQIRVQLSESVAASDRRLERAELFARTAIYTATALGGLAVKYPQLIQWLTA